MRKIISRLSELLTYDDSRQHIQFVSVFALMALISAFMTVLNYFTGWREALMTATLAFSVLNLLNALLEYFGKEKLRTLPRVLFAVEIITLFTFFVINGQPEGFSTLWAALLPACGLLLYKGYVGSLIAGVQLVILIFLFYFPAGKDLLLYDYNDVFMMRFPVLYTAFFIIGLFFELIRHFTQTELTAARDRYKLANSQIMHVLAEEYASVLGVSLESGKMEVFSGDEYIVPEFVELPFNKAMEFYKLKWVSERYRNEFEQFFRESTIREKLANESSCLLTFTVKINGGERYLQARIVRVPEKDGILKQVVIAFSDTDSYVREQLQIQEDLKIQRTKAEDASRAKTDFLFNMSHDIRTPMNAIMGFSDIAMKNADNPDKVREYLKRVRVSGDMLLSLINDVLDMGRIERGKVTVKEEVTSLDALFSRIKSVTASLAASKEINMSFDLSGTKDKLVCTDTSLVDRILMNLVSNAIKYTNAGGKVQISCVQTGTDSKGIGTYRFMVKDNGVGMSETFQKEMFVEFAREENTTIRGIQGTGLGLPMAKKLTGILGGTIGCISQKDIGTTFTVTLPFRVVDDQNVIVEGSDNPEATYADLSGCRVLLVEDNEMNRDIVICILSDKGMLVETASNGKEAVKMVTDNGPDHYDFVLMDIQMPEMNGFEATRLIRALNPGSGLPIIALSANAFEEDRKKSISSGMNAHVSKPIDVNLLFKTMATYRRKN